MRDGVAILMVALFGQVISAIPIASKKPPEGAYSAWAFDPVERSFYRSSFPAIWFGAAAARVNQMGADAVAVIDHENPFLFVLDGSDGPVDLSIPTTRADSPQHALDLLLEANPHGPLRAQINGTERTV